MLKPHLTFLWISGLCIGLVFCAFFGCPHWKIASPAMLLLGLMAGRISYKKRSEEQDAAK